MQASPPGTVAAHFSFLRTIPYADISLMPVDECDCPICLSSYTSDPWQPNSPTPYNRPVLLNCNHTLCISCLARWMFSSEPFPNHCLQCWKEINTTKPKFGEINSWDASSKTAWMTFAQIEYKVRAAEKKWGPLAEKLYQGLGRFAYGEKGSDEAREMKERMFMLFEIYFEPLRHPTVTEGRVTDGAEARELVVHARPIRGPEHAIVRGGAPRNFAHRTDRGTWKQMWTQLGGEIEVLTIMMFVLNILLWNSELLPGFRPVPAAFIIGIDVGVLGMVVATFIAGTDSWKSLVEG